jgi:putative transposase
MILDEPGMKALFLEVVAKAKERYSFSVENFCIMGNHYHLIVRPSRGTNLSRLMQWIMGVFAMRYNKLHGLTGHIWGQRFFSRIIESLQEYLQISGYIDENPVKAGFVASPGDWPYGGGFHRRGGRHDIVDPLPPYLSSLLPSYDTICQL